MTAHLTPPSCDVEVIQIELHTWPGKCWLSVGLGDGGELVLDETAARALNDATSRLIQQVDRFEARIEDEAHNRNEWLKQGTDDAEDEAPTLNAGLHGEVDGGCDHRDGVKVPCCCSVAKPGDWHLQCGNQPHIGHATFWIRHHMAGL